MKANVTETVHDLKCSNTDQRNLKKKTVEENFKFKVANENELILMSLA